MTLEEFRGWIGAVESKYPVLEWRVDGVQVWPMVRMKILGASFQGRQEGNFVGAGMMAYLNALLRAVARWVWASVVDWSQSEPRDGRADAVFLAYSIGIQPMIEGRRFNPLLAPYVELLARRGLSARVWEMSPQGDYNVPRYTRSAYVQPWLVLYRALSLTRPGLALPELLPCYDALVAEVEAAGLVFPYRHRRELHRDVFFVRALSGRFKRWLHLVRPKVVFTADASIREQALCLACRELGIISVEIQHGVQNRNAIYAGWTAIPPEGFALRARAFWHWDLASAHAVHEWVEAAPEAHASVIGGDPWREMWLSGKNGSAGPVLRDVAARRAATSGTQHILVTLSSIQEVVPAIVAEAVHNAPQDWCWWFRMHPVNAARRRASTVAALRELGVDTALMAFATEVPLYAVLQAVDAHLTVGYSTVVQQAASLGVPSVGCSAIVSDLYSREMEEGLVRVALTGEAIVAALGDLMASPRQRLEDAHVDPDAALASVLALQPAPIVG